MIYGYYTNRLLENVKMANEKNYRTMRKHFKAAADEYAGLLKNVGWVRE